MTDDVRAKFKELLEKTFITNYESQDLYWKKSDDFCKAVQELKPECLYRYRNYDTNTKNALNNFLITSSKPAYFKDVYDSLLYIDKEDLFSKLFDPALKQQLINWFNYNNLNECLNVEQKNIIEQLTNENLEQFQASLTISKPHIEYILENLISEAIYELKNNPNIVCLTENSASLSMWQNYGNGHKGIVLEYNLKNYNSPCDKCAKICSKKHSELLFPVIYSNERFNAKDYVGGYLNRKLNAITGKNIYMKNEDLLAKHKALLYKSIELEHEKEWRIISTCNEYPIITLKPTAIYRGCLMSKNDKKELEIFAKENDIILYDAYIKHDSSKYEINYKRVK